MGEPQPRPPRRFDVARYTRKGDNVILAGNTKESYEVLVEIFLGNHLYEQNKAVHDVKMLKLIDMI